MGRSHVYRSVFVFLLIGAVVFAFFFVPVGKAWGGFVEVEIPPKGTYLHADPGQGSYAGVPVDPPAIIDLQSNGFSEGDAILISFNGSIKRGPSYDPVPVSSLVGVFSSADELLPINETYRVPGAIKAGEDIITVMTWYRNENTDIPEDFQIIPNTGFSIEVPQNATYLFICFHDSYYPDNTAPEPSIAKIVNVDVSAPVVGTPILNPTKDDIQPYQNATVTVDVADLESGVKNVTLIYSLDNGTTWENPEPMKLNITSNSYEGTIPGQPFGTAVRFKILAFDYAGNNVTDDNAGQYYIYTVIPEFPTPTILLFFMMATLTTIALLRRRHSVKGISLVS